MINSTTAGLVLTGMLVAVFTAYFMGFPMHAPWAQGVPL